MSPEARSVSDFFLALERHVAWDGERPALSGAQETWSYLRLWREIARRVTWLAEHGIKRLALDLSNGPELLAWDLAALRAGLPCIILPDFFSPAQRAHVLQDCGADLLLGNPERAAEWTAAGFSEGPHGWQRPAAAATALPAGTAKLTYTSGTTGTPKGARRPEPKSWMPASSIMSRIPLRHNRPAYLAAPLFHTWGFATAQLCIALRSTMILRRHFEPSDALRIIEAHNPHTIFLVPTMLQRMLEVMPDDYDVSTSPLEIIASCGSAIPEHIVKQTLDRFGPVLYNQYGSTEVSWATIATPDELAANPTTAGRAPLGTRIAIRDDEGNELPEGETGRIFVGNGMLYEGYTRPGADKEIIDGMVCTGDLGRLENGMLYISGREDDMIVSGGENVFPRETEDALSDLPGVRECCVYGVDDDRFGQALVAWVVRDASPEGQALDDEKIRAHVKDRLARHSVPRETVFMDELPRNAVGKVVPRMLPKPWEDGGEGGDGAGADAGADAGAEASATGGDGARLVGQDRLRTAG